MISVQNIKLRRISINPPPPPPPSWADSEAAFVRTIASDRDSVRIGNLKIGFKFLERLAAETTDTTLRPLTKSLYRAFAFNCCRVFRSFVSGLSEWQRRQRPAVPSRRRIRTPARAKLAKPERPDARASYVPRT